jgi:hypothetical protein
MCCIIVIFFNFEDEKEYILMNLLLLFSADQLDLIERSRVEQIQLHFAMLLHNYLNHRLVVRSRSRKESHLFGGAVSV